MATSPRMAGANSIPSTFTLPKNANVLMHPAASDGLRAITPFRVYRYPPQARAAIQGLSRLDICNPCSYSVMLPLTPSSSFSQC